MLRRRGSSIVGLVVAAVIAVPSMAFVMHDAFNNSVPKHKLELVSASGAVSISNSLEGHAILTASPMVPGQHSTGTVQLANTGDGAESLVLDSGDPVDQRGPGGGALSQRLTLRIEDVTNGAPVVVYAGPLTGLHLADLGTWRKDESRTYRFVVTFPDGGANGADNAYQGSAATIGFTWTADAAAAVAPAADAPYEQQISFDAPIAYWPIDGSDAAMSDLVGNHDGQYSNGITTAGGTPPGGGSAASFDGAASYGYVNSIPAPTSAYSLEAWAWPASTNDMLIVDHGGAGALGIKDGHFAFRQTNTIVLSSTTVQTGRWYHLVGTWDVSGGTARLYVDGQLDGSAPAATAPSGSGVLYVGRGAWASGGTSTFFAGDIAKAAYYQTALSADRITAHAHSGASSISGGPTVTPPDTGGGQPSPANTDTTPTATTPTATTPTATKPTVPCPKVKATSKKTPAKKKPAKKKPAKKKPAKKKPPAKPANKPTAGRDCSRAKKATPQLSASSANAKIQKH